MRHSPIRSNIRPKISSMPRQKSEAAAYLDIYKLVVEKKRLQQELDSIEQRRGQIHNRLAVLESQIQALENKAHELREAPSDRASEGMPQHRATYSSQSEQAGQFKTITLEY